MKRFLTALIILLVIPNVAFSADSEYYEYLNQYDLSFMDELSKDVTDLLEDLDIIDFNVEALSNLKLSNVISIIEEIVFNRLKEPLKSCSVVIVFVLLSALFNGIKGNSSESLSDIYSTISSLAIATVLLAKISDSIHIATASLSVASNFIFAFIPTFCAIIAVNGGVTTTLSTNTMLLALSQGLSFLSSNLFSPIINSFLAIGVCSGLRAELNLNKLLTTIKNVITKIISFTSAMFVSVLSIKTAIASKSDILGIRSVRFLINSVVPIIGGTISEGLLSIQSYSSLIKSTVGIVGIVSISLVFLPSIIEISIWRLVLSICSVGSDMFCDNSVSLVINSFKEALLLINVVLILSMVTTIISIGILIASRTV